MEIPIENIFLNLSVTDKQSLLEYASTKAGELGYTNQPAKLLKDFWRREGESLTGVQDGFAIPHAKSEAAIKAGILYFNTKAPIAWETFDDQPVSHIFALIVPEKNTSNIHLQMISNLATALLDEEFKNKLIKMNNETEISDFINHKMEGLS